MLVEKYPLKVDLTANKVFELTDETIGVLNDLDRDVTLYYFVSTSNMDPYVDQTINMYTSRTDKIKFEHKNPVSDPVFTKGYESKGIDIKEGSLVVESGNKVRAIDIQSMYDTTYTQSGQVNATGFKLEQKLTNALNYVTTDESTIAYFITGHGETGYDSLNTLFTDENLVPQQLDLKSADIPKEAKAIFIVGPQRDFSADELEKIDSYLSAGGHMHLSIDAGVTTLTRLEQYMNEFWGVKFPNTIVYETDTNKIFSRNPMCIIPTLNNSDITSSIITKNLSIIWPYGRSLEFDNIAGTEVTKIATSSSKSLTKDATVEIKTEKQAGDKEGDHTLAATLTRTNSDMSVSKIFIAGTTSVYDPLFIDEASLANRDFLYGNIKYVVGDEGSLLSIAPKSLKVQTLTMSDTITNIYIILFGLLPALVALTLGLVVWFRRRHL